MGQFVQALSALAAAPFPVVENIAAFDSPVSAGPFRWEFLAIEKINHVSPGQPEVLGRLACGQELVGRDDLDGPASADLLSRGPQSSQRLVRQGVPLAVDNEDGFTRLSSQGFGDL